jgi:hypothetical protein
MDEEVGLVRLYKALLATLRDDTINSSVKAQFICAEDVFCQWQGFQGGEQVPVAFRAVHSYGWHEGKEEALPPIQCIVNRGLCLP